MREMLTPNQITAQVERFRMIAAGMPESAIFTNFHKPPTAEQRVVYFKEEAARASHAADVLLDGRIDVDVPGISPIHGHLTVRLKDVFPDIPEDQDRELSYMGDLPWILRFSELTGQNYIEALKAMDSIKKMREQGLYADGKFPDGTSFLVQPQKK